jgi:hypothetical protein
MPSSTLHLFLIIELTKEGNVRSCFKANMCATIGVLCSEIAG